ncbi:S8 family peptidase, partial [Deinococcus xianganensis]|nr:S8 family peptidase [Deinococcus xianganensis]
MNARALLVPIALSLLLAACGQQTAAPQASQPQTGQGAPLLGTANPEAIPGQYVVVFNDDVQTDFTAQSDFIGALGLDPQGVQVQQVYSAALNGFAAKLST